MSLLSSISRKNLCHSGTTFHRVSSLSRHIHTERTSKLGTQTRFTTAPSIPRNIYSLQSRNYSRRDQNKSKLQRAASQQENVAAQPEKVPAQQENIAAQGEGAIVNEGAPAGEVNPSETQIDASPEATMEVRQMDPDMLEYIKVYPKFAKMTEEQQKAHIQALRKAMERMEGKRDYFLLTDPEKPHLRTPEMVKQEELEKAMRILGKPLETKEQATDATPEQQSVAAAQATTTPEQAAETTTTPNQSAAAQTTAKTATAQSGAPKEQFDPDQMDKVYAEKFTPEEVEKLRAHREEMKKILLELDKRAPKAKANVPPLWQRLRITYVALLLIGGYIAWEYLWDIRTMRVMQLLEHDDY